MGHGNRNGECITFWTVSDMKIHNNSDKGLRLAIGQDRINCRKVLPEPVLVTRFIYRNRVLQEIPKGSAQSLSYWIGTSLDWTGTGSYRIIVYR
ncbi:hypothetical protein H5410_014365 [Solanum commersonii]|uniref:Uncharacterized protein n=1 Tax=Solanum commersonii TaxID=4109 RepID=A0A9J5ZQQ8_SOLCO|nr:hypothetical protein H5410_014365 [Solanum commersonii]